MYYAKDYRCYSIEDDYERGEIGHVYNGWDSNDIPITKGCQTIDEILKEILRVNNFNTELKWEYDVNNSDNNRFYTNLLVNNENTEANADEINDWKKCKTKLYSCTISAHIVYREERELTKKEISKYEKKGDRTMDREILIKRIEDTSARSYWGKAIKEDAISLLKDYEDDLNLNCSKTELKQQLLNGAEDWSHYSYSGNAIVSDWDIAKHYCTPSDFKSYERNYSEKANPKETWLDIQARALAQAFELIWKCLKINRCVEVNN